MSEESLWRLVNINLTSRGDNLTFHKFIFFIPHGDNSQNFWQKPSFKPTRYLYEPPKIMSILKKYLVFLAALYGFTATMNLRREVS